MSDSEIRDNPGKTRAIFNSAQRMNYYFFGLGFVVALVLAFTVAAFVFIAPASPPARVLAESDMVPFMRAVDTGDFPAMEMLGEDLFQKGTRIPESNKVFADFETTSYEPYMVYAFHSQTDAKKTRRVLLTMDAEDQVVSFLAEEMKVAP